MVVYYKNFIYVGIDKSCPFYTSKNEREKILPYSKYQNLTKKYININLIFELPKD